MHRISEGAKIAALGITIINTPALLSSDITAYYVSHSTHSTRNSVLFFLFIGEFLL